MAAAIPCPINSMRRDWSASQPSPGIQRSPQQGALLAKCKALSEGFAALCFSRERLRRVLRKKAAVILHLHIFTSADLDLHTFTSADLHLHTLIPADLDLHTFTPADLDLHTFTSADLHLHTFTPADLHFHTFTSADLHLHTLTSADLHLHTPWHLQI